MDGVRHVRHETYGPSRNHPSTREAVQQQPRHSTSVHSSTAGGGAVGPGAGVRRREVRETRRSISNPVILGSVADTRSGGTYCFPLDNITKLAYNYHYVIFYAHA